MSVLTDAAVTPQKAVTGPTQYKPLRDTIADGDTRFQLVARATDSETFVLVARNTTDALVDRINARNLKRAEIDAALKHERDADKPDDKRIAALTEERAALPKVDALRCGPVARALMLYADADEKS